MGLLSTLLGAPVMLPLKAVLWIVEKVGEAALSAHLDPVAIQQALSRAEAALEAGELSEAEYEAIEEILIERLMEARRRQGAGGGA